MQYTSRFQPTASPVASAHTDSRTGTTAILILGSMTHYALDRIEWKLEDSKKRSSEPSYRNEGCQVEMR